MADGTPYLPLVGATRCGYCGDRLTLQPEGDWACERCRPALREIKTWAQWSAFMRESQRRYGKRLEALRA